MRRRQDQRRPHGLRRDQEGGLSCRFDPRARSDINEVLSLDELGAFADAGAKPAETLMNVVALIAKRFDTDVCSAYLLEPDRANLVLAATVGLRSECIGTLRLALHEGLAGLVAEQVRPVAVEQVADSSALQIFQRSRRRGLPVVPRRAAHRRGVLQGVLVVQTIETAPLLAKRRSRC